MRDDVDVHCVPCVMLRSTWDLCSFQSEIRNTARVWQVLYCIVLYCNVLYGGVFITFGQIHFR